MRTGRWCVFLVFLSPSFGIPWFQFGVQIRANFLVAAEVLECHMVYRYSTAVTLGFE